MLYTVLLLLNVFVAIALVVIILLQRQDSSGGGILGGANLGAGPAIRNPLVRVTTILAIVFMGNCLLMSMLSMGQGRSASVLDEIEQLETPDMSGLPELPPMPTEQQ